jgi:hypothetical protein
MLTPEQAELIKQAAVSDAARQFLGRVMSPSAQGGAPGLMQRLFSSQARPEKGLGHWLYPVKEMFRTAYLGNPIDVARRVGELRPSPDAGGLARGLGRFYAEQVRAPADVGRAFMAGGRTPEGFSLRGALGALRPKITQQTHPELAQGPLARALWKGRRAFHPQLGSAALTLGMPALELYGASKAPPEHRGEAIGRALAALAHAPFTSQLGIPGALLLGRPLTALGGRAGRLFDRSPTPADASQMAHHLDLPTGHKVDVPYGFPSNYLLRMQGAPPVDVSA